jgi:hypothetical protein
MTDSIDLKETLTLDAISADPWNAVRLDLPADAGAALLTAALAAADRCVREAHGKMMDVREGLLIPEGYLEAPDPKPDAHEGYENDWWHALERYREFRTRLGLVEW